MPYLAGDLKEYYQNETIPVDIEAGEWITCPECGSGNAGFIHWGEGPDLNFGCPDCGHGYGVR